MPPYINTGDQHVSEGPVDPNDPLCCSVLAWKGKVVQLPELEQRRPTGPNLTKERSMMHVQPTLSCVLVACRDPGTV